MNYKKIFLLMLSIICIGSLSAQKYKWTKYYMEAGLLGGGSFYLGDANEKLFKNTRPTGGLFAKYKFNGHWEIKLQTTVGQAGIGTFEEDEGEERITTFGDLSFMAEFNFFNYAAMTLEPMSSKISPYIFMGVGASYFNNDIAPIVPFGVGVKWRFAKRFNLGAYWSMQKTLWNDNFDLIENPIDGKQNIWNNNDWYSTAAIYISIDFWEICPHCKDGGRTYYYQGY